MRTLTLAGCILALTVARADAQCLGDFNGDGAVSISEIITTVRNSLLGCPTPGPRFVDNGDGTITDTQNGLMWEKKVELDGTVDFVNLHDGDDYYQWAGICSAMPSKYCQPTAAASTLCTANAEDTIGCAQCTGGEGTCFPTDTVWTWAAALNAVSFAGHTDWRIPKLAELQSVVDYSDATPPTVNVAFRGASCGGACTDITNAACSCTQAHGYWSASTYATFPNFAWSVNFFDGDLIFGGRVGTASVRAVRGGS